MKEKPAAVALKPDRPETYRIPEIRENKKYRK